MDRQSQVQLLQMAQSLKARNEDLLVIIQKLKKENEDLRAKLDVIKPPSQQELTRRRYSHLVEE